VSAVAVSGVKPFSGTAIAFGQDRKDSTGDCTGGKATTRKDKAAKATQIETGQGENTEAEAFAIRKEIPAGEDFFAYGIRNKKLLYDTTMLTALEKKIAHLIQGDIPLVKRPFKSIGERAGTSEEEALRAIRGLLRKGIVRKFGTILRHQKAGFTRNAMVIWAASQDKIDATGRTLASFREVTHCYERTPPFAGKYSIFSMVHCREGEQKRILKKLSKAAGIKDFKILISEKEYKKSSMEYYADVK